MTKAGQVGTAWQKKPWAGHRVTPLIEGSETFAALAGAIEQAERHIHMAYWLIDPDMDVSSLASEKADDWRELTAHALRRDVAVRIILADFDPVLTADRHEKTYRTYRRLLAIRDDLPHRQADLLQVMTSRHPARVGLVFEFLGRYVTTRSLTALIGRLNHRLESHGPWHALDLFSNLPGLWNRVHFDGSRFDAPSRHIPVYLGAHHE